MMCTRLYGNLAHDFGETNFRLGYDTLATDKQLTW